MSKRLKQRKFTPGWQHQKRGGKAYRQNQSLKKFIRERDNCTCQICGNAGWIVDHIIPWAISHDSSVSNLRVLCHSCNLKLRRRRKDARPMLEHWFADIELELKSTI